MPSNRSLISPTASPELENALREKLRRRADSAGALGKLSPIAVRLGLIQRSLKPRFRAPQIVVFAGDHGLVVDSLLEFGHETTLHRITSLLASQLPLSVFAAIHGMELSVVDSGCAALISPHSRLLARKIAHGTRNSRVAPGMSISQVHAAIRAGMEIGDSMPGNVMACAAIGEGTAETSAALLSSLCNVPVADLLLSRRDADPAFLTHQLAVLQAAQSRHQDLEDPVELLAALGGFELAMMVGALLVAASRRHLILVDGLASLAALMVSSRIAPAVVDYCVFCRSQSHSGLDRGLSLFNAEAVLDLGIDSIDGTGATLSWPLIRSAGALLTEVAEGEDAGPTLPAELRQLGPSELSMAASLDTQATASGWARLLKGGFSLFR
jgi:nicotinate-nucleotide--dimethylbenzimidazole phosphoribosyltransferase